MKRLGVIIQYYNSREDLPLLLASLAENWELVLFARQEDLDEIDSPFEKRPIPRLPRTLRNRMWKALYELGGNIPGSRTNFKFWNLRRIQQEKRWHKRLQRRLMLSVRMMCAGMMNFDRYLNRLNLDRRTNIDDIDAFLAMTDVYDVNFTGQALASGKPFLNYVYSWDHVAKYHKFSERISRYLTWHTGISEDLTELHAISPETIFELGSTQLGIVKSFQDQSQPPGRATSLDNYVYYAGTMSYPEAIQQELRLVKHLADVLAEIDPTLTLLVRPYPTSKMFEAYRQLHQYKNIELENVTFEESQVIFNKDTRDEKYAKVRDARLFIHMGSTMGLEASYFDTPVVLLTCEDFDYGFPPQSSSHLLHTLRQRHLQKYLVVDKFPNVVKSVEQLPEVLKTGLEHPDQLLSYNRYQTDLCPLRPIEEIAASITEHGISLLQNGA